MSATRELGIKVADVHVGDYIEVLSKDSAETTHARGNATRTWEMTFAEVEEITRPYKPIGGFDIGAGYHAVLLHTPLGAYVYSGSERVTARIPLAGRK